MLKEFNERQRLSKERYLRIELLKEYLIKQENMELEYIRMLLATSNERDRQFIEEKLAFLKPRIHALNNELMELMALQKLLRP